MTPISPREIATWDPKRWSEIVGNRRIVEAWHDFIQHGGTNMLITGPLRSGKTRTISLGIRAALCPARVNQFDPCHACETCKQLPSGRESHYGTFSLMSRAAASYFAVDCESVTVEGLKELKQDIGFESKAIVYLDEVAALGRRGLDSYLLKTLDESQAIWVASSVISRQRERKGKAQRTPGLSDAVLARFVIKEGTTLPDKDSLVAWIKARCEEWEITIEQEAETLPLAVERCRYRVGFVLVLLSAAAFRGRRLTLNLVRGFDFQAPE